MADEPYIARSVVASSFAGPYGPQPFMHGSFHARTDAQMRIAVPAQGTYTPQGVQGEVSTLQRGMSMPQPYNNNAGQRVGFSVRAQGGNMPYGTSKAAGTLERYPFVSRSRNMSLTCTKAPTSSHRACMQLKACKTQAARPGRCQHPPRSHRYMYRPNSVSAYTSPSTWAERTRHLLGGCPQPNSPQTSWEQSAPPTSRRESRQP